MSSKMVPASQYRRLPHPLSSGAEARNIPSHGTDVFGTSLVSPLSPSSASTRSNALRPLNVVSTSRVLIFPFIVVKKRSKVAGTIWQDLKSQTVTPLQVDLCLYLMRVYYLLPNLATYELLVQDRAQALEKRAFRRSGGSATSSGFLVTNDVFRRAAAGDPPTKCAYLRYSII
ncbi:hypothetical protein K443DRAFT_13135 [Laccaria amethystina LaAM-08-1]|uniref:Uncharacterized protein n=1 Tax=Laccaria amethystina LaAM-08-1 TaxID=1095629 RepID=A0A0C9WPZ5_9AGAR|nr:hypothetical protein K443DRAFT_13135 [Laccaria amethystina LaAM-08-1]